MFPVCVDPTAMFYGAEKLQHLSNDCMDTSLTIDKSKPPHLPYAESAEGRLVHAMTNGAATAANQYVIAGTLAVKGMEMVTADGRTPTAEQLLITSFVAMGGKRLFDSAKSKLLKPVAPLTEAYSQYKQITGVLDKVAANPPKHLTDLIKTLRLRALVAGEFLGVGLSGGTLTLIDQHVEDNDVLLNMLDEYEQMNVDGDFGIAMSVAMRIKRALDSDPPEPDSGRSKLELIDDGGGGTWLAPF